MINYILPLIFIIGGITSLLFYKSIAYYNKMAKDHGVDFANNIFGKLKIGGYIQLIFAFAWILLLSVGSLR